MPPFLVALPVLAFPALVLTAALRDALSYRIPNWIPLALAATFPLAALAAGAPLASLPLNLGVGVAALLAGMAMFALRWMGGGDAKLIAAAALWLGWPAVVVFLAAGAIAGGVLALVLISLRSAALRSLLLMGPGWLHRLAEPGEGVPYGVAIAIGALAALPQTVFGQVLGL
jgi:prepilin peptidase CpaA